MVCGRTISLSACQVGLTLFEQVMVINYFKSSLIIHKEIKQSQGHVHTPLKRIVHYQSNCYSMYENYHAY